VPLLAGDLAGLAADADRRVGEEAHPLLRLVAVAGGNTCAPGELGHVVFLLRSGSGRGALSRCRSARLRVSSTSSLSAAPRGRRPGRMSQLAALTSWMCTFGSSTKGKRSLAESPVTRPFVPQW